MFLTMFKLVTICATIGFAIAFLLHPLRMSYVIYKILRFILGITLVAGAWIKRKWRERRNATVP